MAFTAPTVLAKRLVSQISGITSYLYSPNPLPTQTNVALSRQKDFFAGDIGNLWEDPGASRILIGYGDCLGSNWAGGPFGTTVATSIKTIGVISTVAATAYNGTQSILCTTSLSGLATAGWLNVETTPGSSVGGAGGWALFTYAGISGNSFTGVQYWAGGGNVSSGLRIATGDPRANGGFQENKLARSTDTSLAGGMTFDSFLEDSLGTATQPWPATTSNQNIDVIFPLATAPSVAVTSIKQVGFLLVVTCSGPHGLTQGRMAPGGPGVRIVGNTFVESFVKTNSAGIDVTTFNGTQTFGVSGSTDQDLYNGATASARRISVQTSTGYAILSYTSVVTTDSKQLKGVQWVSGSGTTIDHGLAYQGCENVSDNSDKYIYDTKDENGVASTTKFRILTFGSARDGGVLSGCRAYFPNMDVTDTRQEGNVTFGGCAIPWAAAPSGWRQIQMLVKTLWNGDGFTYVARTYCWYSDDGGDTWTQSGLYWENVASADDGWQGVCPMYDAADHAGAGASYVYLTSQPGAQLARCLPADMFTKSNWRYWNGTNWTATAQASATPLWSTGVPYNAITLWYSNNLACWVATYSEGLQIVMRFAPAITGPWSASQSIVTGSDYVTNYPGTTTVGLVYGGWIHPYSGRFANDADKIYITFTMGNPYNVFLLEVQAGTPSVISPPATPATECNLDRNGAF
jgi:hypothetical protein